MFENWKPFTYKGRIYDENDIKELQKLNIVHCRGTFYQIKPAINKCVGCKFNLSPERDFVYADCIGTVQKWLLKNEIGDCLKNNFIFEELFVDTLIKFDWKPDINIC